MKEKLEELIKKQEDKLKLRSKIIHLETNLEDTSNQLKYLKEDKEEKEERSGCGPTMFLINGLILLLLYVIILILLKNEPFPVMVHITFLGGIIGSYWWYSHLKGIEKNILNQGDVLQKQTYELSGLKSRSKKVDIDLNSIEKDYRTELKKYLVKKYDSNNNGLIDQIEFSDNFSDYLNKTQNDILKYEKDEQKNFVHQFVKISEFIEENEKSINSIFKSIISYKDEITKDINHDYFEKKLEHQIYLHKLLVLNGLVMINSLLEDDRITFYKIYEKFDKLNVFNSHFQNQLLDYFKELNNNLLTLIDKVEELTYTIEESFRDMDYKLDSLDVRLNSLNNSIETQSLLTGINTYQLYKINKKLN